MTSLITGDGTYSLRISDSQGGADYSSKEGANPPQLVITLSVTPTPTDTSTPSPTATATDTPTATPTYTPSNTPTPTGAATSTDTPTATATFTPTDTATFTPTPTNTPPPQGPITILYDYDPLNRLTAADYSTGDYYHYAYDAVGNRKTQERMIDNQLTTDTYFYDHANRIETVNGVTYTWDANGNLRNDGVNSYDYDSANRLVSWNGPSLAATYAYRCNGESIGQFGCESDRVSQTVNGVTTNYVLDSASPLTQVLQDGTNTYVYGIDRIAQINGAVPEYFLTDGLGSVRQLVDSNGNVTLAKSYQPYGTEASSAGSGLSSYGFTGELTDSTGLIYLRSRYLAPNDGRFLTKDSWMGDYGRPLSLNRWNYVGGNPVNYTDSSGHITEDEADDATDLVNRLYTTYNVRIPIDWGYRLIPHLVVPIDSSLGVPIGCYWDEGYWRSLRELELTEQAIIDVATTLGGSQKFIAAMNSVKITRVPGSGKLLHALGLTASDYASPMSVPPPISAFAGDLVIPNTFFDESDDWVKYIISHELGHRWDFETNLALSRGLINALGTWICSNGGNNCEWFPYASYIDPVTLDVIWERPAGVQLSCAGQPPFDCPEPYALTYGLSGLPLEGVFQYYGILPGIEDWAESFANYVYPNYYPSIGLSGLVPNGVRESYVRKQINSLP